MGKPAARMGDTTAHGGTVVLGNPTLLIGKMPAATLGDMHVCPMCNGPVPHVGGAITLGSMGVLLGKKPGARVSDLSICVGPPSMPAVGCFTVLIGEVGSGSQAGSAAAAAAAAAASKQGPKAVDPFPLAEPPGPAEAHEILVEFTDSAGKPLSGVKYAITDPDKAQLVGASTLDGAARHAGYAKQGGFELFVPELKNAKWKPAKLKMGEEAEFEVDADVAESVQEAKVVLFENRGNDRRAVAFLDLPVEGKKVKGRWKPAYHEVEVAPVASAGPDAAVPPPPPPEKPTYDFLCVADGLVAVSDTLTLADRLEIELLDADGKGIADAEYELILPGGEIRRGRLDGSGKAKFEDLEPGGAEVRFPGHLGNGAQENEIVMDEVVITAEPDREIELEEVAVTAEPESGSAGTPGGSATATATATQNETANKVLDKDAKVKVVAATAKIESGAAGYSAMNLDYEFEGRFDYPERWFKTDAAKPGKQNRRVPQSKYFDTPEHVGLSYGIIQFTQQYLLGPLLKRMKAADAAKFSEVFGDYAEELLKVTQSGGPAESFEEEIFDAKGKSLGKKKVRRKATVRPVGGHDLWKPYWTVRFREAGDHPAFRKCQDEMAVEKFLDPIVSYAKETGMERISEKSLSLLYDRKVQEGNAKTYVDSLRRAADEKKHWTDFVGRQEPFLKKRMQKLLDDASVSWEAIYAL